MWRYPPVSHLPEAVFAKPLRRPGSMLGALLAHPHGTRSPLHSPHKHKDPYSPYSIIWYITIIWYKIIWKRDDVDIRFLHSGSKALEPKTRRI